MNIEQLKYFVAAARSGSFAEASRQSFVSSQAIAKAIKILETEIGATLFEKEKRPLRLTSFGEDFFHEATCVIWDFNKLKELNTPSSTADAASKQLRIAVPTSELAGDILSSDFFTHFADLINSTEFIVTYYRNNDCLKALEQNRADSAFIFGDSLSPRLQSIRVRNFTPVLYIHKSNPLACLDVITPENSHNVTLVCASELHLYQKKLYHALSAQEYHFRYKPASPRMRTQLHSSRIADEVILGIKPPFVAASSEFTVRPLILTQKTDIPFCLAHHESSSHPLVPILRKYAFGK